MQAQRQASFFRPPHSTAHHLLQQRHGSYFKPSTQQQPMQREAEGHCGSVLQSQGERLTVLHSRLQQEAEKIRKWKNATELEIRQKDTSLLDAQQTIDSQRKLLTGLQLQNEALDSRFREQVESQQQIQRKIQSTRDLCVALKDRVVKVEGDVEGGERDRERLLVLMQQNSQQYQALLDQFRELENSATEREANLCSALCEQRSRSACLKEQCLQLQQQLSSTLEQLSIVDSQLCEKRMAEEELEKELSKERESRQELEKENASLTSQLGVCHTEMHCVNERVSVLEDEVRVCRCEGVEREGEIKRLTMALTEKERCFQVKCADYEAQLESERVRCGEVEVRRVEVEDTLQRVREEAVADSHRLKAALHTALEEAEHVKECLVQKCHQLEEQLSMEHQHCEEVESERKRVERRIGELESEVERVRNELAKAVEEELEKRQVAESTLTENIAHYKKLLCEEQRKREETEQRLAEGEGVREERQRVAEALREEVKTLQDKLEEEQGCFQQGLSELRKSLQEREEGQKELRAEVNTARQRELSLRSQLECLEQQLGEERTQSRKQKEENEALRLSLREQQEKNEQLGLQLSHLEGTVADCRSELEGEVARYKADVETASLELQQAKKSFDTQVGELCAMLEKYQAENGRMVAQKDRELGGLRQQLSDSDRSKEELEKELSDVRLQVALLEQELKQKQSELCGKDGELQELLKAVECVQTTVGGPLQAVGPLPPVLSPSQLPPTTTPTSPTLHSTTSPTPHSPKHHRPSGSGTPGKIVPCTPKSQSRVYDYRLSATPKAVSQARSLHSTCVKKCDSMESKEEALFRELYPRADTEEVFKRPRGKVPSSVCRATTSSSGGRITRRPFANCNGRPSRGGGRRGGGKKTGDDLSWFDLDSVYGFGPDD